jgi:excisionase family DNA binding protein
MKITLGQAAKQAGISKSYLSKLIKTGKISAERQPNGEFRIDPSELDRLSHIRRVNTQQKQIDTPQKQIDTPRPPPDAWLKEREVLLALVNALNDQVNDLREQRDVWQHQAERLLLTMPTKPRRRWWQVFTRGVR